MPDNKSISQLITAEQTGASDLYELAIPNAMTETGYISRKVSASELANLIVSRLQYQGLSTDAKTILSAINEASQSGGGGSANYTDLIDTLEAGETSITITDSSITTDSTIDFYTDVFGVNPIGAVVGTGQITLTFEERSSDLGVKVRVWDDGVV